MNQRILSSQFLILSALTCLLLSCGAKPANQEASEPKNLAANPAKTKSSKLNKPNKEVQAWQLISDGAILIDVRSQREYDQGHLDNVLLINHEKIRQGVKDNNINKDQSIVVYCRSGGRAEHARQILLDAGYTKVFNAGGYEKMKAAKPSK